MTADEQAPKINDEERDIEALPALPGPNELAGGRLWQTPRLPSLADTSEVKIRLMRRAEGLVVHVTAPNPELAERVVRDLFGPEQPYLIEMCG